MASAAQSSNQTQREKRKLLNYLLGLSGMFLALELFGSVMASSWVVGSAKVTSSFEHVDIPLSLILSVAYFVLVFLLLHGLILWWGLANARLLRKSGHLSELAVNGLTVICFLSVWLGINIANSVFFPRSFFSHAWFDGLAYSWQMASVALALLPTMGIFVYGLFASGNLRSRAKTLVVGGGCVALGVAIVGFDSGAGFTTTRDDQPNIVVIGVDSVRHDVFTDPMTKGLTPSIEAFFSDAVRFDRTYTPLARTYPSWMSLLTGQLPKTSGARVNLLDKSLVNVSGSLAWSLKSAGYQTIFAMDERRFSNINEDYGFDEVLGPQAGAADFLLGLFSDIPLVNLVSDTRAGRWLFPYNTVNRALHRSYDPDGFSDLLSDRVTSGFEGPVFIATHFCLPHWPYTWKDSKRVTQQDMESLPEDHRSNRYSRYLKTLPVVDQQVTRLLADLEATGVLDNAIVVMLSDHGEDFGLEIDQPRDLEPEENYYQFSRFGHGTNIFSETQSRILLGMRRFGGDAFAAGSRDQTVGTIDIAPTLLDLASLPLSQDADGKSLRERLFSDGIEQDQRFVMMETGYSVAALEKADFDVEDLVEQGVGNYLVDEEGMLVVNPVVAKQIVAKKQIGATDGTHTLGLVHRADVGEEWYLANWQSNDIVRINAATFAEHCSESCQNLSTAIAEHYGKPLPRFFSDASTLHAGL